MGVATRSSSAVIFKFIRRGDEQWALLAGRLWETKALSLSLSHTHSLSDVAWTASAERAEQIEVQAAPKLD
jgi:hypothetical protein